MIQLMKTVYFWTREYQIKKDSTQPLIQALIMFNGFLQVSITFYIQKRDCIVLIASLLNSSFNPKKSNNSSTFQVLTQTLLL